MQTPNCRQLLAGQEGRTALAKLDAAQRAHLQIYAPDEAEPEDDQPPPEVSDASDALREPQLLALAGRSYEQWVQRFADALALHAWSPALRACRRMAVRQAHFAELLLPHLLADLAAHDHEGTLCRRISRQVRVWRPSAPGVRNAPEDASASASKPPTKHERHGCVLLHRTKQPRCNFHKGLSLRWVSCIKRHNTLSVPQVTEHVLNLSAPDPQAVRLLLACLNHLRGRRLDALERGHKATVEAASAGILDPSLWRKVWHGPFSTSEYAVPSDGSLHSLYTCFQHLRFLAGVLARPGLPQGGAGGSAGESVSADMTALSAAHIA